MRCCRPMAIATDDRGIDVGRVECAQRTSADQAAARAGQIGDRGEIGVADCETKGRGLDRPEPAISPRGLEGRQSVPIPGLWEKKACPRPNRITNVVRPLVLVGHRVGISQDRAKYTQRVAGCEILRIRRNSLDRKGDQKNLKAG
jgi:hypothetical protein